MIEKYKITYSNTFDKDLASILMYIKVELQNESAANRLYEKIVQKISNRAFKLIIYEKYRTIKKRKTNYYRIYINNYTVFYTIKNNTMEIRRILYSKRNIKSLI